MKGFPRCQLRVAVRRYATRLPGSNCVVAALHFESSGSVNVARCHRAMIAVLAETVRPTITELATLNGDVFDRSGGDSGAVRIGTTTKGRGRDDSDLMGAMVASIAGGEAANTFLIALLEFSLEWINCPLGGGTVPRDATRWILAILDQRSSIGLLRFQGLERAARMCSSCHCAILAAKMLQHGKGCDIAKAKIRIF